MYVCMHACACMHACEHVCVCVCVCVGMHNDSVSHHNPPSSVDLDHLVFTGGHVIVIGVFV